MLKNPIFTLILGLIVGSAVGFVLGERQAVPPQSAMGLPAAQGGAMPEGHPQVPVDGTEIAKRQQVQQQAAELEDMLAQTPNDHRLMVAIGNLYYDAAMWPNARGWYERAIAEEGGNPDVLTDLAVVYRNLGQPQDALGALDQVLAAAPEHWQARFNRVVILHFDLHEHEAAEKALADLEALAAENPEIPDLSTLQQEIRGSRG